MTMASISGTPVAAIARLVVDDEGTVRDVIHATGARRGGSPVGGESSRLISDVDMAFVVTTATRPGAPGRPVHASERAEPAAHTDRAALA